MKELNTLPIEDFLNRARVAIKSNQRDLTLSIKEVTDLQNSLSIVMTRLAGELDGVVSNLPSGAIEIRMNGGQF
jgi:hypothetical protein